MGTPGLPGRESPADTLTVSSLARIDHGPLASRPAHPLNFRLPRCSSLTLEHQAQLTHRPSALKLSSPIELGCQPGRVLPRLVLLPYGNEYSPPLSLPDGCRMFLASPLSGLQVKLFQCDSLVFNCFSKLFLSFSIFFSDCSSFACPLLSITCSSIKQ